MKKVATTIILLLKVFTYFSVVGQDRSDFIVVDQFGYRPNSQKVAVIRNPHFGRDRSLTFEPGNKYALIDESNGATVFEGAPASWNSGEIDVSSGDQVWWFDFSSVIQEGHFHVLDVENNVRSFSFSIADDIYAEVLKQAMRTYFYQRAGFPKEEKYSGSAYTDQASHLGTLQDPECRKFDRSLFSTSERDLRGGWYDAGDYNKYTPWTANYVIELLQAYEENEEAWADNYCLPYSGNGIPDIIDEVRWGLDYLLRLQEEDGSMWSVVSLDHAYPPSEAKGPSLYGDVNTVSALSAAAAFAYSAKVFTQLGFTSFGDSLKNAGISAWEWAKANPKIVWKNNDAEYNSTGIGAGQQETDDYGRLAFKMRAAVYLFKLTSDNEFKTFVESNYQDIHLISWQFAYPYEEANQEALLYYANMSASSPEVKADIRNTYEQAILGDRNLRAIEQNRDPYLAFLNEYVWGSNGIKAKKGSMLTILEKYNLLPDKQEKSIAAAENYIHYLHGVNPLNFCYLSNMGDYGSDNGVSTFFHAWFADGSPWDIAGGSKYGPAPGYLVGGPNASYDWDDCCSTACSVNCDPTVRNQVINEPDQKAYLDFNTSWPMNSWELTENSLGYQTAYIRLLSKFVDAKAVESTICTLEDTSPTLDLPKLRSQGLLYPNPVEDFLHVNSEKAIEIKIISMQGKIHYKGLISRESPINLQILNRGAYMAKCIVNGIESSQMILVK